MDRSVEVVRGELVESSHKVHCAVVDSEGRLRAALGDPDTVTYFRSGAKPFQAIPLIRDGAFDRFGISLEELALCCGSHSGEARHLEVVVSLLRKIGVDSEALACGAHPPIDERARRDLAEQGIEPMRLHNNCSGKHAGMLALARAHGWETVGYHRPEHPVQGRILSELSRWAGVPFEAIGLGIDGCGAVCFALPLRQMAFAYASLAGAARSGERDATYIVGAMTSYPDMVGGEGRLDTDYLISEDDLGALWSHAYPDVMNTCGEVVGQIRARLVLESPTDA
jgi:L-asparaginase II